jgi:UDP-glucose 4-epimerase
VKALVSGGAGFIGSHLVDALVARGDEVTIIDDLSTGRGENIADAMARGARLIPADVTDLAAVERICLGCRPDRVFHLAAQVDVRVSVSDPGLDVRVNVEGTVNLLDAARQAGAGGFVLASSCAVYGEPAEGAVPLREDSPLRPGSPYGQAKLAAEGYVALYRELHRLQTASLRFGNVYGPRQGAVGEAGVVSIFCRQLIQGGRPTVFGDGNQTRDFVYVGDVVRAILAASDRDAIGEFNVGTGRETSVLELVEHLATIGGRADFVPEMEPGRPGEIARMALNADRLRSRLDWRPQVPVEVGLRQTWESNQRRRHDPDRAEGGDASPPPASPTIPGEMTQPGSIG